MLKKQSVATVIPREELDGYAIVNSDYECADELDRLAMVRELGDFDQMIYLRFVTGMIWSSKEMQPVALNVDLEDMTNFMSVTFLMDFSDDLRGSVVENLDAIVGQFDPRWKLVRAEVQANGDLLLWQQHVSSADTMMVRIKCAHNELRFLYMVELRANSDQQEPARRYILRCSLSNGGDHVDLEMLKECCLKEGAGF